MIESIKYIANMSKELLRLQIEAFRNIDNKSGIIVGIASIFLPLFINALIDKIMIIKTLSLIPITVMLIGIIIILYAIRSYKLGEGIKEDEYNNLINQNIKDILLIEISYNKYCISTNNKIVERKNKLFNIGLILIIISIILSIALLSITFIPVVRS